MPAARVADSQKCSHEAAQSRYKFVQGRTGHFETHAFTDGPAIGQAMLWS